MNSTLHRGRPGVNTRPLREGWRQGAHLRFDVASLRACEVQVPKIGAFPSTAQLLTDGGDARIACAPHGANQYGCAPRPQPGVLAFGSSTASTISSSAFAAADALRNRLENAANAVFGESPSVTYERELNRVRRELAALCGIENLPGLDIIFGASGTDLHLFASQLMMQPNTAAPLIVRVEAAETGRGVPDALAGCHFSDHAALGDVVHARAPLDCGRAIEICEVACRSACGELHPAASVDAAVEEAVTRAASEGRRVLLTVVDVSKTGVIAPSPACVAKLQRRFPKMIEVFIDACQFRLAPSTLRAYLDRDYLVAITGSKFITGPTFCGALLVPRRVASRLRCRPLPHALKSYSPRADWPRTWAARDALKNVANYGLLLRWEAALAELRAFRAFPENDVADFLATFSRAVTSRLAGNPAFELLPVPALDRRDLTSVPGWDAIPTIFSFLLRRKSSCDGSAWLSREETKRVHELLRQNVNHLPGCGFHRVSSLRCEVGQPVACGSRDGIPVSALRLCASSRLVVDALSPQGRGAAAVVADALAVLDKAALLASLDAI